VSIGSNGVVADRPQATIGVGGYPDPMSRRLISSGSSFERDIGYSRAVVVGNQVFVSGTTGFDYSAMTISNDVAVQAAQCLRNIESALREAGASMQDVVRVRYILPRAADFPATWPARLPSVPSTSRSTPRCAAPS
jgi:enamine deaminase RidA (YjgF/YER057c/UK114 family)